MYKKILCLIAIGLLLSAGLIGQPSVYNLPDWSAAFPSIQGCERVVQPVIGGGKIFEQTANYGHCGSITLRREEGVRKRAMEPPDWTRYSWLPPQPTRERGYFALRDGPQCGNDFWIGSTSVYFDSDKVLIVSARVGGEHIFDFLKTVDYLSLRRLLRK